MAACIVLSKTNCDVLTGYGPFNTYKQADDWRNSIADPNTAKTTNNIVIPLHKPDRIVSE
jgi:hypothetical protein